MSVFPDIVWQTINDDRFSLLQGKESKRLKEKFFFFSLVWNTRCSKARISFGLSVRPSVCLFVCTDESKRKKGLEIIARYKNLSFSDSPQS